MEKDWNTIWKNFKGLNKFGIRLKKEQRKVLKSVLTKIKLPKNSRIIDVGCGSGFTLNAFRDIGYKYSIGIDISKNSINLCKKLFGFKEEKDVFLMNAKDIKFSDNSFDLVFSDGLLEHFKKFTPVLKEMCRISKSWVLLFQPNPTSFVGLMKKIKEKIGKASWEKEYYYTKNDYIKTFPNDFILSDSGEINFYEEVWLLFRKVKK